jgi:cardiolipin synthase
MEALYEQDLAHSTEIVLRGGRRLSAAGERPRRRARGGSAGRLAAGAIRIGNTVEAAITSRRFLVPAEARMMAVAGAVLVVAWPPRLAPVACLAVLAGWVARCSGVAARASRRGRRRAGGSLASQSTERGGGRDAV